MCPISLTGVAKQREDDLPGSRLQVGKPRITLRHARHDPDELVNEIWVEDRLDDEWVAVYRLAAEDGRAVVAAPRILPYDDQPSPLLSIGESQAKLPAGGFPARHYRSQSNRRVLQAVQRYFEDVAKQPGGQQYLERVLPRFNLNLDRVMFAEPQRRPRRSQVDVAIAARAYADANPRERRQAVANAIDCSLWGADKLIREAKDRLYLVDGELTERARQILGRG
jgi:hypothetical protein